MHGRLDEGWRNPKQMKSEVIIQRKTNREKESP